ncbi:MAG: pyridoxal phosphate-dependent aminotransferase family protein [Gemmatimonadota bacterium]
MIFDKANAFTEARETREAGLYPYFQPIEESTVTEVRIGGEWKIMLGSNNYLGLTHHPKVLEAGHAALERYGSGSTGSRLLNGTLDLHVELEDRLARLFQKPAALVFSTGFLTNLGILGALCGRDDHLFLDRRNHASLVDASRLSMAEVHRFPHLDHEALGRQLAGVPAAKGKLVAIDGIFSMEGVVAPLPDFVRVCREHGARLMVDDAHGLGVLGDGGAGTPSHFGVQDGVDLHMASFSKSLASIGGVLAGSAEVIDYLRHRARPFIFSASMPPASVAGVLAALDVMANEPGRRERLWENTRRMKAGLESLGYDIGRSETPIIPVAVGAQEPLLRFWRALFERGVFTHPVFPPAVPANSCLLRLSLTAAHTDEQIDRVLEAFEQVGRESGWLAGRPRPVPRPAPTPGTVNVP